MARSKQAEEKDKKEINVDLVSEDANNDDIDSEFSVCTDEIVNLRASLASMEEYAKRTVADMENMKKRNQNIASDMYKEGSKDVIIKFLPIVDNFDRALSVEMTDGVKTGFDNIRKMLSDVLDKLGVKIIESLGAEFDPNYHNALMQIDDSEKAGKVVNVFEQGYLYNGKVLRHASVVVAK